MWINRAVDWTAGSRNVFLNSVWFSLFCLIFVYLSFFCLISVCPHIWFLCRGKVFSADRRFGISRKPKKGRKWLFLSIWCVCLFIFFLINWSPGEVFKRNLKAHNIGLRLRALSEKTSSVQTHWVGWRLGWNWILSSIWPPATVLETIKKLMVPESC